MAAICLKVLDKYQKTIAEKCGEDELNLLCNRSYQEGDHIILETTDNNQFLWLQLDDAMGKSLVYVTGKVTYEIPFGERRRNLSPKCFCGEMHLLYVRVAKDYELHAYRNLALNVNDQHGDTNCYPHATANVETRGESVFAAKNAIDGITSNESHGDWPYQSWGINRRDDAQLKLDFGRTVSVDRIVLYTRADFPHDNWWKRVTFTFSDGSSLVAEMNKSRFPHEFIFEKKEINWVTMNELIKSEEESPFPALTQLEVYGSDIGSRTP